MRRSLIYSSAVLLIIAGCSADAPPESFVQTRAIPEIVGKLEDDSIREASGLAYSRTHKDVLWVINDGGAPPLLYATNPRGKNLGKVELETAINIDWEDLATARIGGDAFLLIADIGDNDAAREHVTLYTIGEPATKSGKAGKVSGQDFVYPDGPRDAESAAIDVESQDVLILSKRDLPPRLYAVPASTGLTPDAESPTAARYIGDVRSLHVPSQSHIDLAPTRKDWYWQPVGMDISPDNGAAVILTYREVYYFVRQPEQSWLQAFNSVPVRASLGDFQNAEAITFGETKHDVFVTGENRNSRLLHFDFSGVIHENNK